MKKRKQNTRLDEVIIGDISVGDILFWGEGRKVLLVVDVYQLASLIHIECHSFAENTRVAMSGRKHEMFYYCKRISHKRK